MNTNSAFDFPAAGSTQQRAVLTWLANSSTVANRIDKTRLAVSGHSMGGGGSLISAQAMTSLQAAVPLMPFSTSTTNVGGIRIPTMATTSNTTQAKFLITWMKRYVDNDTRFEQFMCPNPGTSSTISQYRDTCPG